MNSGIIAVGNPLAQYRAHEAAIKSAVGRVLEYGHYILGPEVVAFEQEFAAWLGAGHCIGVANGTDALLLALKACGIRPDDEVITVSQTAVATVAAIELAGAVPVFVDIDPLTRCMAPELISPMISEKTRAIVPVHLYGQPAPMVEICTIAQKHGLLVIEDCAQAHGAMIGDRRVGTFGSAAAFSFYPTKNLGAIGDGGAVVTNNHDVAERCRLLRQYGWKERYVSSISGMNSRLDELQAAILRIKLPFLDADNQRRRDIASEYGAALDSDCCTGPRLVPGTTSVMHLYVIECLKNRQKVMELAAAAGICTGIHYPQPVHQQPAYVRYIREGQQLPITDQLVLRILTLPLYPELTGKEVKQICRFLASL